MIPCTDVLQCRDRNSGDIHRERIAGVGSNHQVKYLENRKTRYSIGYSSLSFPWLCPGAGNTGEVSLMNSWKIKKGYEPLAKRIILITGITSTLLGIAALYLLPLGGAGCFTMAMGAWMMLSYIGLGWFGCYRNKRFRGHLFFRWALFALMMIYSLFSLALFLTERPDGALIPWFVGIPLLVCSIQCVRNGYC